MLEVPWKHGSEIRFGNMFQKHGMGNVGNTTSEIQLRNIFRKYDNGDTTGITI